MSVVFVATAYLLFILVRLAVHDWDLSYFVTAGDKFTDPKLAPRSLHVIPDAHGHDGQFYYRFALDPFTNTITDYGITLDLPAYRHQRILYPVLANLLSIGILSLVPFWMIAINYFGLCAIAWTASKLMQSHGLHALWGLAIACYPGFILTLARDFTEILAAAFVLAAVLSATRQQPWRAAILLSFGVLARETSLLVAVALGLAGIIARMRGDRTRAFAVYAIPVSIGIGWQLYLRYNWGHFAASDTGTMGLPFTSFVQSIIEKMSFASGQQTAAFFQMLLVAGFAVSVGIAARSSRANLHEKLSWLLYCGLACVVSGNVWSEDWSFLRNLWELYAFGAIILAASHSRARAPMFGCWAVLWLFEFALRMDVHKLWG